MTTQQRRYLFGEVYPAIVTGIDILLIHEGRKPWGWSVDTLHERWKESIGVDSIQTMTHSQSVDYMTHLQAFAASCLIFVASPEEWERGIAERERLRHYDYVLDYHHAAQEAA